MTLSQNLSKFFIFHGANVPIMSCRMLAKTELVCHDEQNTMDTFISILQAIGIILIVILFFNFMIFVHELGHFLAGKWRGAYIDRFQIWFGKPIWSKKIRGVEWGVGWIPAGGFVSLPQLEGMESIEGKSDLPKDIKPLTAKDKVIIAAAGPLFSLLLAFFFACIVWAVGKPVTEITDTRIGFVMEGSPADKAGLRAGDIIRKIDGEEVTKWMGNMEGVREKIALSEHETITLTVERAIPGQEPVMLDIQTSYEQPETKWWQRSAMRRIGISMADEPRVAEVMANSPAAIAGIKPNQLITHFYNAEGEKIQVHSSSTLVFEAQKGKEMKLELLSDNGTTQTVTVTPVIPENWQGLSEAKPILGIKWGKPVGSADDLVSSIDWEYPTPTEQVGQSLRWMGITLDKLLAPSSSVGMEHLSGPVGIGSHMYDMMQLPAAIGWRLLLWFAVIINVNLAVLNILPLPVVDGGHVTLGIAEMLRGKPVNGAFLNWIMTGFIFLILFFFIFVTFKDVGDLVGKEEELPAPVFNIPAQP